MVKGKGKCLHHCIKHEFIPGKVVKFGGGAKWGAGLLGGSIG